MADLYASYTQLAAAQTEGVDYTRTAVIPTGATWASIAIHGGGIEAGSGEVAQAFAGSRMRYYQFAGIKASGNTDLHVTSTNFDEPQCVSLVAGSTRTFSFHGFTGTTGVAETAVGGLDAEMVAQVTAALTAAGFAVITAPSEIAGTDPDNVCNENLRSAGVQLELSRAQREAFFPGGSLTRTTRESGVRTQAFYDYVAALESLYATTLTATPEPGSSPPRVALALEWTDQTSAMVMRVDPDGRSRPVRLAEPATLTGGVWSGYDYESPFGEPVTYTATSGDAVLTSAAVTLNVNKAWLRHPGIPSLSTVVDVQGDGEPVRKVNRAVLEPLGRRTPVVITDGRRKSKASTIVFRTYSQAEVDALLAVTDDTSVLLLDIPPSWGWGVSHQYMALGDLTETRTAPRAGWLPGRLWTAPYEVVGRPVSAAQGQRTWAKVLTEAATWGELMEMYDTWGDVLTGNTS